MQDPSYMQNFSWFYCCLGKNNIRYWIGLTEPSDDGKWIWNNGASVTFTKWDSGQPNDWSGGPSGSSDCAALNYLSTGGRRNARKWMDTDCLLNDPDHPVYPLCETSKYGNILNSFRQNNFVYIFML